MWASDNVNRLPDSTALIPSNSHLGQPGDEAMQAMVDVEFDRATDNPQDYDDITNAAPFFYCPSSRRSNSPFFHMNVRWVMHDSPQYLGGYSSTWGTDGIDKFNSPLKLNDGSDMQLFACRVVVNTFFNVTAFNHSPSGYRSVQPAVSAPSSVGCTGTNIGYLDGSATFESTLVNYRSANDPSSLISLGQQ